MFWGLVQAPKDAAPGKATFFVYAKFAKFESVPAQIPVTITAAGSGGAPAK